MSLALIAGIVALILGIVSEVEGNWRNWADWGVVVIGAYLILTVAHIS